MLGNNLRNTRGGRFGGIVNEIENVVSSQVEQRVCSSIITKLYVITNRTRHELAVVPRTNPLRDSRRIPFDRLNVVSVNGPVVFRNIEPTRKRYVFSDDRGGDRFKIEIVGRANVRRFFKAKLYAALVKQTHLSSIRRTRENKRSLFTRIVLDPTCYILRVHISVCVRARAWSPGMCSRRRETLYIYIYRLIVYNCVYYDCPAN